MSVPVIDIAPFIAGTAEGKRIVARQIGHACRDIGFLSIVGHGVPNALLTEMSDVSRRFFDLPLEEKMKVAVNIGDMMQYWTNDRWRSTVHRVINPPSQSKSTRRQSLVFFHTPNENTLIECLPSCCSADNPPRYAPILAGEHMRLKSEKAGTLAKDK